MIPLKQNFTYLILNDEGQINSNKDSRVSCPESGGYLLDTRTLSRYEWDLSGFTLLHTEYIGSRSLKQHFSKFEQHKQSLLIVRTLTVTDDGFVDELMVKNDDLVAHDFVPDLALDSDFIDMFEVRGHVSEEDVRDVHQHHSSNHYDAYYLAPDQVKTSVQVDLEGFRFQEHLHIAPKTQHALRVVVRFESSFDAGICPLSVADNWLHSQSVKDTSGVYRQAELDLHDLLLSTRDGLTIAAGIPWFVTPFGRDSIISAWLLLKSYPELARGTLNFLAKHQGQQHDEYRDEQPGKILHEQRYAEFSRLGKLPFLTYYGTADATPLFLMLLHDYVAHTDDTALLRSLRPNWLAALDWMEKYRDERGLIVFRGNDKGLTVQSWKDSHDSLSYRDGRLGEGALAVAEVQGYAYAAYVAAASFFAQEGDTANVKKYQALAVSLKANFEALFWMPQHQNYAIALDEHGKQLDINSSDSGHLLWSGIVAADKIDPLVERLFREDLWSGWGLRTLGTEEARYNPISYHNGSVWPHDTALFAAGLKRHDKTAEFERVKQALIGVAQSQKDKRLPELFAGYAKDETPILPYVEACRPQAWSAAALVYLMNDGN